jgi:hypothetical protein
MRRALTWFCLCVFWGWSAYVWAVSATAPLYILQANDLDPTAPTSQPAGRWYHWLGCDPAVTHLETGLAIDSAAMAGRGQRIRLATAAHVAAIQVKVKRIGQPGALCWEAGTAWGRGDLGHGQIAAKSVAVQYERFVTLSIRPVETPVVFLRLRAASGRCPDDYYAVYCTWRENHPQKVLVNAYDGKHEVGMMFRALHKDPLGEALESDGRPVVEGASMMTRLLTLQAGAGRRQLLPGEEEPYTFVDRLAAGEDPRLAGLPWPGQKAAADEIAIGDGWRLLVTAPRSPAVATAVGDLADLLRRRMRLSIEVAWDGAAKAGPHTITLAEGPNLADGPRTAAGYRFAAEGQQIHIHGRDARGVLRGIWYLEDLMALRGGPLVKRQTTVREPRYAPRATCAAWGGTGELCTPAPVYTDEHLRLISRYGYDAIWIIWWPGPERDQPLPTHIAPGRVPEGLTYQPFTARLIDLTERASRYGLDVVINAVPPYPVDKEEEKVLQEQARQLLRDAPRIKAVVFGDEGMGSTRHGMDAWTRTCSLLETAFAEVRPEFRTVAWRYTFRFRSPDRETWDRSMTQMDRLDPRIGYMAPFDSFWMRRRDGILQEAYDYCLSLKAPSEDFRYAADFITASAHKAERPARPLWAHIETRFSQESNTQPEIPCMQRWAERFDAVNGFRPAIEGLIANWYHQGFYPTPVTELFGWMSYSNAPPTKELLRAIARRDFGSGQEDRVLAAWGEFSEAIWHFPFYYGLSATMNAGLAQPFWLDAKMVNPRPWRRGFVNSLKEMALSNAGEGPGSGPENRARLGQVQKLWHAGLERLRQAAAAAPPFTRSRAQSQLRTAQSFSDKVDVTLRLVAWLDARGHWQQARTPDERCSALDELERIGRAELAAARAALPMYLCDSRMGHLNHGRGCFTAMSIESKIAALGKTLDAELPVLRRAIAQP